MPSCRGWLVGAMLVLSASAGLAQDAMTVAGRVLQVEDDGSGGVALVVDGARLLRDGVIYLDPAVQEVAGLAVVTGVAGAGGNACNAAPFVLALPEDAPPQLFGPVESCAYLPLAEVRPDAIVFAADPLPDGPGEVWVWSRDTGFAKAPPQDFAASAGWDGLDALAGAHPVEALKLAPVLSALQAGLGPDFPVYAERISGLGAGDLTPAGYLGEACLKYSCDEDWAALVLDRTTQGVFAIWHVAGEATLRVWPEATGAWPPSARSVLDAKRGG